MRLPVLLARNDPVYMAADRVSRDKSLEDVAKAVLQEWRQGWAVAFHCLQTYHRGPLAWGATVVAIPDHPHRDLSVLLEQLALVRRIDESFRGEQQRDGHGVSRQGWRMLEARCWAQGWNTLLPEFPPLPGALPLERTAGLADDASADTVTIGEQTSAGTAVSQRSLQDIFEGSSRRASVDIPEAGFPAEHRRMKAQRKLRWAPKPTVVVLPPVGAQDPLHSFSLFCSSVFLLPACCHVCRLVLLACMHAS